MWEFEWVQRISFVFCDDEICLEPLLLADIRHTIVEHQGSFHWFSLKLAQWEAAFQWWLRWKMRAWLVLLQIEFDDKWKCAFARDTVCVYGQAGIVMANLGQVLKKQVSGFDFKKPGYPGRVLGFQNCTNLANLDWKIGTFCQITKLELFISPKYGNFKLFSEFLNILPQSEIFLIHQFDKPHAQYI